MQVIIKQYTLFILLILSLVGCKSARQSKSDLPPIVMFEKTECFGTCPSYAFKAYPDGRATFTGRKYVDLIGEYETTLSKAQLDSLGNLFEAADYFKFANVYSANIEDRPTVYLYYDNGRQNSKVTDYYGAPQRLKELEQAVEEFIFGLDWQLQQ